MALFAPDTGNLAVVMAVPLITDSDPQPVEQSSA